jgi:hypothetical protein
VTQQLNHRTTPDELRRLLLSGVAPDTVALPPEPLRRLRAELLAGDAGPLALCFALLLPNAALSELWGARVPAVRQLVDRLAPRLREEGDRLRAGSEVRAGAAALRQRAFPVCFFVLNRGCMPVLPLRLAGGGSQHVLAEDLPQRMRPGSPLDNVSTAVTILGDERIAAALRGSEAVRSAELVLTTTDTFEVDEGVVKRDRLFVFGTERLDAPAFALLRTAVQQQHTEVLCFGATALHETCFAVDNYARRQNVSESAAATSPNMITVLGMKILGFGGSLAALTGSGAVRRPAAAAFARTMSRARVLCGNSRLLLRRTQPAKRARRADVLESWEATLEAHEIEAEAQAADAFAGFACAQAWDLAAHWAASFIERASGAPAAAPAESAPAPAPSKRRRRSAAPAPATAAVARGTRRSSRRATRRSR